MSSFQMLVKYGLVFLITDLS